MAALLLIAVAPTAAGEKVCNQFNPRICAKATVTTDEFGYVDAEGTAWSDALGEGALAGLAHTAAGTYPLVDGCNIGILGGQCLLADTYHPPPKAYCGEATVTSVNLITGADAEARDTDC